MPMTNQEYIDKDGQYCPFCESSNIQITSELNEGIIKIWQSCKCNECNKQWNDVYMLVKYEEIKDGE